MSLPRGRVVEGGKDWEFGISKCKLLYIGGINNKVLYMGIESKKEWRYIYIHTHTHTYIYNRFTLLYSRN